jgi:glycosyltransferase involved in cell wall biosynthesis
VIPNTFPTVFEIVQEVSPMHNPVKLMMLGRIDPFHKGMDRFFNTLRALPESMGSEILVELYGFGSEENMNWVHEQIQNTKNVEILFKGAVFMEEKTEAFKNADIFCMFSRYEGLPLTLYEAAASGLPIIVTEGSNRTEWVMESKNGWVLWDRDEADWGKKLTEAIGQYIKDPMNYKENAIASAKSLPTWDEIAISSVAVYRKWGKQL